MFRIVKRYLTYLFIWLQGERVAAVVAGHKRDLWVTESLFKRCIRTSPVVIQTAISKRKPWKQCYSHYRGVARLLRNRNTQVSRFLLGGVGGGGFLHTVRHYYPYAEIKAVEIDPMMLRLARVFFNIPAGIKVIRANFRDYLQGDHGEFDFIFIDAFDGMYPPEELCEEPFLKDVAKALSPDGIVCMNTVRKHPWDRKYRGLRYLFSKQFGYTTEIRSFWGKVFPVLPHNIVLVGDQPYLRC